MRLNVNMFLLEQMSEGVLLLNHQGILVGNNQAGLPWKSACSHMLPYLKRLIQEEMVGRLELPVSIVMRQRPGGVALPMADAWLCKNGRREYALFILADKRDIEALPGKGRQGTNDSGLVMLMGAQVRQSLADFEKILADELAMDPERSAEMRRKASELADLLKDMSDLAQLMGRDLVFAEQRLDMLVLLDQAFDMAERANINAILHRIGKGPQPLGTVYGEAHWLTYALRVLIEGLYFGAPKGGAIQVDVRQTGDFVMLTGHVVVMSRAPLPQSAFKTPELVAVASGPRVHLQICRRILELHGAQLKLVLFDSQAMHADEPFTKIESFSLALLTGMPEHDRSRVSCGSCPITQQAVAYAQDLANLI